MPSGMRTCEPLGSLIACLDGQARKLLQIPVRIPVVHLPTVLLSCAVLVAIVSCRVGVVAVGVVRANLYTTYDISNRYSSEYSRNRTTIETRIEDRIKNRRKLETGCRTTAQSCAG